MNFYVIFFLVICGVLLWVTIRRKEIYPFSYYPMYSSARDINEISVFRIALKTQDESMIWWKSEFYRYPEYVGRRLKQLCLARNHASDNDVFLQLEHKRLLILVLRILEKEEKNISNYKAFCIVERRINDKLEPEDKVIETIPLSSLKDELF
ncbi:MAG TPA: hypothetical protein VJ844_01770 [Mucilaginibacter sp.]|nr:hypothetical protein [Mucilaginibacter sp.]